MPNSQADVTAGAPNLESYTDNNDGTVTDNVTGLMWQQAVSTATKYTWSQAVATCPTLALAGHSDWRLQSIIELVSIVDLGQVIPSINGTYFPSTPAASFWSSTAVAGSASKARYVTFYSGGAESWDVSSPYNVRCVRAVASPTPADASAPAGQYVVTAGGTGSGTVYDTKSKLTWQQTPPTPYSWADAKTYCASLGASLGGTGWRLPTGKELQTIVDYSQASAPLMDPNAFLPGTPSWFFWSASVVADSTSNATGVSFYDGTTGYDAMTSKNDVRCVR